MIIGSAKIVIIRAYRGQHWKGNQNEIFKKEIEGNINGVKLFIFIRYQNGLAIAKYGAGLT